MWSLEFEERERKGIPQPEPEEGEDEEIKSFKLSELERDSMFVAYKMFWKEKEEGST